MKAKIIFEYKDEEAIKEAQNLGIPEPESIERLGEFYFDLEYIHAAYLNKDKDIVIYLPSGHWILEYDESIWVKIRDYLAKIIL